MAWCQRPAAHLGKLGLKVSARLDTFGCELGRQVLCEHMATWNWQRAREAPLSSCLADGTLLGLSKGVLLPHWILDHQCCWLSRSPWPRL